MVCNQLISDFSRLDTQNLEEYLCFVVPFMIYSLYLLRTSIKAFPRYEPNFVTHASHPTYVHPLALMPRFLMTL